MMNFRSVKQKKQKQKHGILFFLVIVLIVLGFTGVYRFLSTGFSPLASPFWRIFDGEKTSLSFVWKDKKNLERKVSELEQQIESLQLDLLSVEVLRQENENFKKSSIAIRTKDYVSASILVKPNHTLYNSLIVDSGAQDGVRKHDTVLAFGKVAIGRVSDVRKNISHIELFSENSVETSLVHSASGIYVDAVGHGGGMVSFTLPRDTVVTVGDVLVFPSRESFIFGTVEQIKFDATDPVQKIIARSAVNISELRFVELIHSYEEQF